MKKNKIILGTLIIIIFALLFTIPSQSIKSDKDYPKLVDEILRTNSIIKEKTDETGLHLIENDYYFIGIPMNNYVKINENIWRIIKIDKNSNILLIMQDGINNDLLYKYNEEYNNKSYKDSIINKELLHFYDKNLKNINYIIEQDYCIYFENECIETELSKISLITPDILQINNIKDEYNNVSYLVNRRDYWVLKNNYDEIIDSAFSGYVSSLGNLDDGFVDEEKTIRPIITITSEAMAIGTGTIGNPYILKQ